MDGNVKVVLRRNHTNLCQPCGLKRVLKPRIDQKWRKYLSKNHPSPPMGATSRKDLIFSTCPFCGKDSRIQVGTLQLSVRRNGTYVCRGCARRRAWEIKLGTSDRQGDLIPFTCTECGTSSKRRRGRMESSNKLRCQRCTPRSTSFKELAAQRKRDIFGCSGGKLQAGLLRRNKVETVGELTLKLVSYLKENKTFCSHPLTMKHFSTTSSVLCRLLKAGGRGDLLLSGFTKSSGETEVFDFLKSLTKDGSPLVPGDRSVLGGKEIDILIPELRFGVEYNGNIWHSEKFKSDKMYHLNKRLLAESKGVRLIQIRDDEWLNKRPIVKSLLKAVLKESENRYFARKLTIAEVPGKRSQKFLQENHLMGGYRSSRHLGLFTPEGQLVQLFSFKLLKDQTEMDCSRICSLRNCSVVGGVSRLLKAALRKHPSVQRVISFVDLRYADGHSLEKIGFVRDKVTLGWGWTNGINWFNRLRCKADPKRGLTERENAALKGWYRIYDAGQAKYIMETTKTLGM